MANLALSQAAGSPPAAESHFKGNGELVAEPGSSLLGAQTSLCVPWGQPDFGQLSQESLNHHQSLFLHRNVPPAQGVSLGRQGGSPTQGCRHNPQTSCSTLRSTLTPNPTNLRGMEHSLHAFESFSLPIFFSFFCNISSSFNYHTQ